MTYPQDFVQDIIHANCVPTQVDTSVAANQPIIDRFHHVWTPDLRILDVDASELYRWNGFLPPAEFAAQLLAALGQARLRLRQYEQAQAHYEDALRRFPTALAAAEACYFLAVTNYRKTDEANALLHGWHDLEKTYPMSEWTVKQNYD